MALHATHTDDELLSLLKNGDEGAFAQVYERYWARLYDAAYGRLRHHTQAEDIVQDIFVGLWSRKTDLNIERLGPYLHKAVRYKVLDYVARSKEPVYFHEKFESLLLESDTPEGVMMAKELFGLVLQYAETLPGKRRQIFLLHIQHKLTAPEIAERLGVSAKTVSNQLGTALSGLRPHIAPLLIALVASRL